MTERWTRRLQWTTSEFVITLSHTGLRSWAQALTWQGDRACHQEALVIHFTIKICWGGAGHGSAGRSEFLCSHSSFSQQGEKKHWAKRINTNRCWFFFFWGLKRNKIGAKCPSWQRNDHYAISPWLSMVWGSVSLKSFLFWDEIQIIMPTVIRFTSAMLTGAFVENLQFVQSQISMTDNAQFIQPLPSIPR